MLLHAVPFQKKSPLRVFPRERYVRRETILNRQVSHGLLHYKYRENTSKAILRRFAFTKPRLPPTSTSYRYHY